MLSFTRQGRGGDGLCCCSDGKEAGCLDLKRLEHTGDVLSAPGGAGETREQRGKASWQSRGPAATIPTKANSLRSWDGLVCGLSPSSCHARAGKDPTQGKWPQTPNEEDSLFAHF